MLNIYLCIPDFGGDYLVVFWGVLGFATKYVWYIPSEPMYWPVYLKKPKKKF